MWDVVGTTTVSMFASARLELRDGTYNLLIQFQLFHDTPECENTTMVPGTSYAGFVTGSRGWDNVTPRMRHVGWAQPSEPTTTTTLEVVMVVEGEKVAIAS